jgi:hypothetical protein
MLQRWYSFMCQDYAVCNGGPPEARPVIDDAYRRLRHLFEDMYGVGPAATADPAGLADGARSRPPAADVTRQGRGGLLGPDAEDLPQEADRDRGAL